MTRVEYRISAARFFLKTMVEQEIGQPEFDWLLEAFISTARSVGWLMRAEVRDEHRHFLDEWQRVNPPEGEVADLYRQLNEARIRITKVEPARTKQIVKLEFKVPPDKVEAFKQTADFEKDGRFTITGPFEGPVTIRSIDGKHEYTAEVKSVYQAIDEFPDRDILEVAEKYVKHLELRYHSWRGYYKMRAGSKKHP